MPDLISQITRARGAGVPLVAVRTPDPASAEQAIRAACNGTVPIVSWDLARGARGLNDPGVEAVALMDDRPDQLVNPTEFLILAEKLPRNTVAIMRNLHRLVDNEAVVQAVSNLRDPFKSTKRTLIALGVDMVLPSELAQEMVVLDEELPDEDQLAEVVDKVYIPNAVAGTFEGPTELPAEDRTRAVGAVSGLSKFMAEQAVAMSMSLQGIDPVTLWDQKRQMIEQTKGLSVYRGDETLDDVRGVDNLATLLKGVINGNDPPRALLWIDEIEKSIGSANDTSNVSQDFLRTLLAWMEDSGATGIICIGPPGSGKSMVAKAMGGTAGIPTIALDLGGMKGSLVGQSEGSIRTALSVVDAVGRGRVFVIATCNSIGTLPPELRRRFTVGTWFFEMPDKTARRALWRMYSNKFKKLAIVSDIDFDDGWTGAEIRNCCDLASRLRISIEEAASYIIPVSIAASATIDRLRIEASGRYLSASYPGRYQKPGTVETTGRVLELA